jgi:hypothetical protein
MFNNSLALIKLGIFKPQLLHLVWKIRKNNLTYLQIPQLLSLIENFLIMTSRKERPLEVAEFGVGRGGSAMLLAWLVNFYGGTLTLFDVFGLIPSPTEIDGEKAEIRYKYILTQESNDYYGNIQNLQQIIMEELSQICDLRQVNFIKGKYEDVLPTYTKKHSFDLVHIDCDWYLSSRSVWDYLQHNISLEGIIQVDDYLYWKGSRKAFDETEWLIGAMKKLVGGALVVDTGIKS